MSPRLEIEVASPALSEHLVLSGGASLRLVATVDSTDLTPTYEYRRLWDSADRNGETQWPRFLEFGVTAKYVL